MVDSFTAYLFGVGIDESMTYFRGKRTTPQKRIQQLPRPIKSFTMGNSTFPEEHGASKHT